MNEVTAIDQQLTDKREIALAAIQRGLAPLTYPTVRVWYAGNLPKYVVPTSVERLEENVREWARVCLVVERRRAKSAIGESDAWAIVKAHTTVIVGWETESKAGRAAGSAGYDMLVKYWLELKARPRKEPK